MHKLEYRCRLVSAANALAIFHDGHHRDPGALARWSVVMSSRVVQVRARIQQQVISPSAAPKVSCGLVSFGKVMWFGKERYRVSGIQAAHLVVSQIPCICSLE